MITLGELLRSMKRKTQPTWNPPSYDPPAGKIAVHTPVEPPLEKNKDKFYSDKKTLEGGSTSTDDFLNMLSPKDKWIEQCPNCREVIKGETEDKDVINTVPMTFIQVPPNAITGVDFDSVVGVLPDFKAIWKNYQAWLNDPKYPTYRSVNPAGEFWHCRLCLGLWTIESGFWVKALVWGKNQVELDKIKTIEERTIIIEEKVIDPGIKLSEDSTLCPNCKVWREVKPYEGTIRQGWEYVQHVCPKCKSVDIVPLSKIS